MQILEDTPCVQQVNFCLVLIWKYWLSSCGLLTLEFSIRLEAIDRDRKLFLVSLYFLIWGEAANVRFLPECICYIFHQVRYHLVVDYTPIFRYQHTLFLCFSLLGDFLFHIPCRGKNPNV